MAIAAKPVFAAMGYTEPKTGVLTAGGQQALAQWHSAINSIPISVSGEQAQQEPGSAGNVWTLANTPSGNVSLLGVGANGPVPLTPGKGNAWNYSINGGKITTEQAFEGVVASYEYTQNS
jgi:hypothetical protein